MKKVLLSSMIFLAFHLSSKAQCNAAFTYSITNNIVNFMSADSLPYGASVWYFGDGSAGWASYFTHPYNASGTYSVKHIVYDSLNHCSDSTVKVITVNFTPSCNASFSYYQDSTHLGNYYFYDQSAIIGSYFASATWTINGSTVNDTLINQGQAFNYSFTKPGIYHVCEMLQTSSGCTSSSCQDINVVHVDSCSLNIIFTDAKENSNPFAIQFTSTVNTSSTANVSYSWYFGDGATDTTKNPIHTYTKGIYNVTAYAFYTDSNKLSCSSYYYAPLYVNIGPVYTCSINFTYTANSSKPNEISFAATGGQVFSTEEWYIAKTFSQTDSFFVDTSNYVQLNSIDPKYTFTDSGYYWVRVQATTQSGCIVISNWQTLYIDSALANVQSPDSASRIAAYPNPATNTVNLSLALPSNNTISINIYSSSGILVLTKQVSGVAGNNQVALPVQNLKPGVYYAEINYGSFTKRSRFQKM